MRKDKIVDEYLKGGLPFSDLYRRTSEGEQCPDYLAARILAEAARWRRLKSASSVVKRLQRAIRSRYERHRFWVETVLPMAIGIALVMVSQMPTRNNIKSDLECRSDLTAVGKSLDRSIQTHEP